MMMRIHFLFSCLFRYFLFEVPTSPKQIVDPSTLSVRVNLNKRDREKERKKVAGLWGFGMSRGGKREGVE